MALTAASGASEAKAGPLETVGTKMADSALLLVSDRTLGAYFGGLVTVSETHRDDCGATIRVTSGTLPLAGAILALRRVADCAGPKPILALRFTISEAGADTVRATMRARLGAPCLDGPGALGATSLIWSDAHRVLGVVQDQPPSRAFSVFFVSQEMAGSSDPDAERGLRRMLEADLPAGCRGSG